MTQPKVLSAGVIVVRRAGDEWKFLLLRVFGYWDFPKGIVEKGEEPLDAAIREVEEETTIDDLKFRWGHDFRESAPYNRGKVARYYLAETQTADVALPVNPELGKPEHDEYRWLSFEEARKLVSPRVSPIIEWAREQLASRCKQ